MKHLILLLSIVFALAESKAQLIYKIKADSVLITNDSCTAELNLENSTKHIKGFLYNKGNGRTEFRRAVALNDSTFVFGNDTLIIRGSGANSSSWKLTGNIGTDTTVNFLGTTDSVPFVIRVKNKPIMSFGPQTGYWSGGTVGIGSTKPHNLFKLQVNGHQNIDPTPSLVPGVTGGILVTDEFASRPVLGITAGGDFDRMHYTLVKANGTLTNPLAVTSNSRLGGLGTYGYDGTASYSAGSIDWWVDGPVTPGNIPAVMLFLSNPPVSGNLVKMFLRSNGNLTIGAGIDFLGASNFRMQAYRENSLLFGAVNTQTLSAQSGGFYHAYNSGTPTAANLRLGGLVMGTNESGTIFRDAASIAAFSEGAFTNGSSHPAYLSLSTTATGTGTPAERMRISAAGNVGIGTATPAYKLDVNGKLGVRTIDSTGAAANVLYQDPGTGEIKKAALGGLPILLLTDTLTNVAQLDLVLNAATLGGQYGRLEIQIEECRPATDNTELLMRFSSNSGASFNSGASDYEWTTNWNISTTTSGAHGVNGLDSDNKISILQNVSNNSAHSCNGSVFLYHPFNSGLEPLYDGHFISNSNSSGKLIQCQVGGRRRTAQATNAIRLYFSSGNIARIVYSVIGYKR